MKINLTRLGIGGITFATYPEPRQVYVTYKSLFPEEYGQITSEYIKPTVMLEVSARSLMEPHADATVNSMLSEAYSQVDSQILHSNIRTALPAKTFLERRSYCTNSSPPIDVPMPIASQGICMTWSA